MAVQRVSFAPQGGFGGANRAAFLQNSKNIGQGLNRIKSARELKNFKAELGAGGDPAALMAKYPQFRKEIEGITSFKQTQQNKADRKEMVDLRVALEGGTESTWEYLQKRMEAYKASGDEAGANRVQKLGMAYIQNPEGVTEKIVREHTLRFPDDAEKILGVEALGQKGSNALKALEIEQGKLVTERDKAKTAHVNANTAKKKQEADEKYKDAELKLKENQQEIDAINAGKPSTALEKTCH
jgi:sulfite reductase alpha subunit-like flavoprotein